MSQHPGAGHDQPSTPNDGAASAGRARKPSRLGIIGLVLVGIQLIAVLAGPFSSVILVTVWSDSDAVGQVTASAPNPAYLLFLLVGGLIGLAGWVVGVVATVTNRGRSFGIAAIVLGAVLFVLAANMMFGALLLKSVG